MSRVDCTLMAVIKRYVDYYKTSTYVLYNSVCPLTFSCKTYGMFVVIIVVVF